MSSKVLPEAPRWTPESLKKWSRNRPWHPRGAPKGPKELKKDKKYPQITENHEKNTEKIAPKSYNILAGNE